MNCVHCGKEVGFEYRRDSLGNYFCNDRCYEDFDHEEVDLHPYIDSYEMVRRDCLMWEAEWEDRLQDSEHYLSEIKEFTSALNAYLWDYYSFMAEDFGDGIYRQEIAMYLRRMEDLIGKIRDWRPKRKVYKSVFLYFDPEFLKLGESYEIAYHAVLDAVFERDQNNLYKEICKLVNLGFITNDQDEPFDNELFLVYETEEEATKVKRTFRKVFSEKELEIQFNPAVLCDCLKCGSYVSNLDERRIKGWIFYPYCYWLEEYALYYS